MAARDLGGRRAALAGGLLYAISPAAEVFSRRIWNPDWVPLFSAFALWGAVGFARFGDPRRFAASWFSLGCAVQLHPTTVVLFAPVLVLGVTRRREVAWRPLAIAGLGLLLLVFPYLRLQAETEWADLRAVSAYLEAPKALATEVPYEAVSLVIGDLWTQAAEHRDQNWRMLFEPAALVMALITVVGMYVALRQRSPGWVVIAWLALPILASLRSIRWVEPHYLLAILPPAALLGGLGVAALRPRRLSTGLLVLMVLWRAADNVRFQQSVAALDVGPAYGVPLRYTLEAASQALLLSELEAEPPNPRDGTPVFVGYPYAYGGLFHYLTQDRFGITHFDSRDTLILRPSGGLYLVAAGGQAGTELANRFGSPRATVSATTGQPVYVLYRLTEQAVAPYFGAPPGLSPLEADIGRLVRVRGYHQAPLTAGQSSELTLGWQVAQPDEPRWQKLARSVELRDEAGRRWSTDPDAEALVTSDRQSGDFVLSRVALSPRADAPTGGYRAEVAFFEQTDRRRLRVYEGERDIGDALVIGPIKVSGVGGPEGVAGSASDLAFFGSRQLSLLSAEIEGASVRLVWRALVKPEDGYTVFVHALDAEGRVVAQHDSPPVNGTYPTSLWDAGEVIADVHLLEGEIGAVRSLAVGLYHRPSLERLPVSDVNGRPLGDHVLVPLP